MISNGLFWIALQCPKLLTSIGVHEYIQYNSDPGSRSLHFFPLQLFAIQIIFSNINYNQLSPLLHYTHIYKCTLFNRRKLLYLFKITLITLMLCFTLLHSCQAQCICTKVNLSSCAQTYHHTLCNALTVFLFGYYIPKGICSLI